MQAWLLGVGIALIVAIIFSTFAVLGAVGYLAYRLVKLDRLLRETCDLLKELNGQAKIATAALQELRGFTDGLGKVAGDEIKSISELRLTVEDFRKALFSFVPRRPAREFSPGTEEEARQAEVAREEQLKELRALVPREGAKDLGEVS